MWPLTTCEPAPIFVHSSSTCAWVLPCCSQYSVTAPYQYQSLTSIAILPAKRGLARSSQLLGSCPDLMSFVFHAGTISV